MIKGKGKMIELHKKDDVLKLDIETVDKVKDLPILVNSNKAKNVVLRFINYINIVVQYWKTNPLEEFVGTKSVEVKEEDIEFDD